MRANHLTGSSRRDWFRQLGLATAGTALGGTLQPQSALAAAPGKAADTLVPLNRFPRMMQEYFVARVREAEALGQQRRAALQSKRDALAYVSTVRANIQKCFGPWPEKTPLNPRITGTVERDSYTIEKVIFESRPGLPVTANLYLPRGRKGPLPGVVGACGHEKNAKAHIAYQSFAQGLARLGYVTLLYDPIGQGERLQYPDEQFRSRYGLSTAEHLQAGTQQFLVGEFFGTWCVWDGIRALDYLLTRPEVALERVGVTGHSGGGMQTTWLAGVDSRWCMAAPSCFITTFRRKLENELGGDPEQCPPRALALGLDHADFLAALAPKPVIILGEEKDFTDVRGAEESFARLQRLYDLLGARENIALFIGPTVHDYSQECREAMYRWFNRVTKISTAQTEPQLAIEKDETLWCTPHGQVAEWKPRTIFSFTQEKSQALAAQRGTPSDHTVRQAALDLLKLPEHDSIPDYRILRPLERRRHPAKHTACYAIETEPGILALVYRLCAEPLVSRPPSGIARAVLYIAHQSADAELREEPLIAELVRAEPQSAFYACDVRGIGESQPYIGKMNSFLLPSGSDYFCSIHSIMLDRPYLGQKTFDVLRVLAWLAACGHKDIHLAGKGWGAIPATFAALLAENVIQVTLKNAPTAYAAIAENADYTWPLATLLPHVLEKFDLPDCYRLLTTKKLRQIEQWGPCSSPQKSEAAG